jgi:hypothetical protein
MRTFIAAALVLAGTLVGGSAAQAQRTQNDVAQACYEQAWRQALQGEALKEFMEDCTSGQVAERPSVPAEVWQRCEERTRLLRGEEKRMAMRDCTAQW